uniref:Tetratricopeptide repeat protein n=1 Tax=Solanum tuberosum TaxID=4113 RepID=M1BIL7_SOLTU
MRTPIEEVSAHLKEFNYEDWISELSKLTEWVYSFGNQHFPSSKQQRISDIEHQVCLCIEVLESVPQEKRELNHERAIFEYLKGRFYNAIPDVYKEEAERHLVNATRLNPRLRDAWHCLGSCFVKKGHIHRAKRCYQTVLEMVIFRCFFISENPAKHIEQSIKYAQRMLVLDDKDGICLYILGCAHFTSFLLTGGRDHNNLQLALEAYEKAKKIVAAKANPHLEYDCSMVNRYLENYKMSLIGFSDAASMNPASDALHQMKLTLQLLDKLEGLIQCKRNDKNKGKSKGKSMETNLPALIESLANIDLNPLYNRATMDLLAEGPNKRIAVIAAVWCLVKYEYKAPVYYMLCDSDENSFVLIAFGILKEAIKQGDQVTVLEPICKFIDFEWEGKHYQFKSVRVNLLEQVLVNGNALPPNSVIREPISYP